jgi:adaptin ear-binding coat-associated protein 1/2
MADEDSTTATGSGSGNAAAQEDDEPSATSALRQRLLTVDEVYVYKIPPLKNAGGHRCVVGRTAAVVCCCCCYSAWCAAHPHANDMPCSHLLVPVSFVGNNRADDWNLANPLQTCQLIVERRGDVLVLEFSVAGALFCQSVIDLSPASAASPDAPKLTLEQMVEAAVDTSRYFVTRIQGPTTTKDGGKKGGHGAALIGFGFRERDTAVDFRESIQFYQRAMQREQKAEDQSSQHASEYSIPKLGEDEKIHVNFGGAGGKKKKVSATITKAPAGSTGSGPSPGASGSSSAPLLLKKPPPPSDSVPATDSPPKPVDSVHEVTEQLSSSSLGLPLLDAIGTLNRTPDSGASEKVENEDDENDWDDFQSAA